VVALTANALKGSEEQALAAGCSGYISKPIELKNFMLQVTELFGEGVGPAEMPFPKTILMIEDDAPTREVVRMACVGQNLTLLEADTGEKGMEMIEKSEPDLVILDLNLPGVSGMDVCRQLRADGTQVPVIMRPRRTTRSDVVVGLEVGPTTI